VPSLGPLLVYLGGLRLVGLRFIKVIYLIVLRIIEEIRLEYR